MINDFSENDIVMHRNGGKYIILEEPKENHYLEDSMDKYYKYKTLNLKEQSVWIRCKKDMEDGRFEIVLTHKEQIELMEKIKDKME